MATRAQSAVPKRISSAFSYHRRPISAPSFGWHNRKYSATIETFLTGITADVLRMRLRQAAAFRNMSLVSFLHKHQIAIISGLSRLKGLLGFIYPPKNDEPNLERWSIRLLCIVLRASDCLTVQEQGDVAFLEKCYRKHFSMRPQSSSGQIGFANMKPRREWIQLCSAVQRLVENVGDPVLIKSVRNFICKVEMESKTFQAQRDMKKRLYDTILELIASDHDAKKKIVGSNGNIIQRKVAEIQKLKQNYIEATSKPLTENRTERKPHGHEDLQRPRMVSAVSFKSPYDNRTGASAHGPHMVRKGDRAALLTSPATKGYGDQRVSPNMGKDISARVAYQHFLQNPGTQVNLKRERRPIQDRPYTAPELHKESLHTVHDNERPLSSNLNQVMVQNESKRKHKKTEEKESVVHSTKPLQRGLTVEVETDSNTTNQKKDTKERQLEKQNKTVGKPELNVPNKTRTLESKHKDTGRIKPTEAATGMTKKDKQDQRHRSSGHETMASNTKSKKVYHGISIQNHPQHHLGEDSKSKPLPKKLENTKQKIHNKTTEKNRTETMVTHSNNIGTNAKMVKHEKEPNDRHKTFETLAKPNLNTPRKLVERKPEMGKEDTTGSPNDPKNKLYEHKLRPAKLIDRRQTKSANTGTSKRSKPTPVPDNVKHNNEHVSLKRGNTSKIARVVSAKSRRKFGKHVENKHVLKKQDTFKKPSNSALRQLLDVKAKVQFLDQKRLDNRDTDKTVKTPLQGSLKANQHDQKREMKKLYHEKEIQNKGQDKETKKEDHEKEMKKIAMEVLVHQNVKSVVGHKVFKNKDTIDEFFDFLYRHQIVKKFLKSPNSEPYKKWQASDGKSEYFCFLHSLIFRNIDPDKDEETLYVVEKILTRMQCQHLRTPRSGTPLGSMFNGRKSLLQEALEYSRSNTPPILSNKSRTSSRSSSSHHLSRSYAGSPPKARSMLEATSRSLSVGRQGKTLASSSRCWKCKQKDLAMRISVNWGNKCICDLLHKEEVQYKSDHLMPAVKVKGLQTLKDIVDCLKERNEWIPDDSRAKDALYEARKLKMRAMVEYLEEEGVEDERLAVQKVCVTCVF